MKTKTIIVLALLALPLAARGATIQAYAAATDIAGGDYFVLDDVSDVAADASGTTKKLTYTLLATTISASLQATTQTLTNKSLDGDLNTFADLPPGAMKNADWGNFTMASGVATLDAGVVTNTMIANNTIASTKFLTADWGDMTNTAGVVQLDASSVDTFNIADGDYGFFSFAGSPAGVATVDVGAWTSLNLAGYVSNETGSGALVFSEQPLLDDATLNIPTFTGQPSLEDDKTWIFNPGALYPGMNVGSHAGNPSTSSNGGLWYNSTTNKLMATVAGATVQVATVASQSTTLAAAATTVATTSNLLLLTGDAGANTLATITGGVAGQRMVIIFADALVTLTDTDAHTANTVDLAAPFTSADDKTLDLVSDGTSWYEVGRSTN